MEKNIKKLFFVFLLTITLFCLLFLRIALIQTDETLKVKAKEQQTKTITLISNRANIYDTNLTKLTNTKKFLKALVFKDALNQKTLKEIGVSIDDVKLEELKKKDEPVIFIAKRKIKNKNILFFEDRERYTKNNNSPTHLIGYIDRDKEGVSGIEYFLNDYFKKNNYSVSLDFLTNRKKEILNKDSFCLNSKGNKKDGVVLTINSKLQYILNTALQKHIKSGAGLILNSKTGEILAITSVPSFNPYNIKKDLNNPEKPLYNRALQKSPVGSVFKIVTAACALENNISINHSYCCKGFYELKDTKFKCHKITGHQTQDLKNAMKNSCNPYFIDLGLKLGAEKILSTTKKMGFTRKISLLDGLVCNESTLEDENMKKGDLANFSFGQGKLKASMLHIAQMLSIVCNEGVGVVPQILKGYVEEGNFKNSFKPIKFNALNKNVCTTLKDILRYSVEKTPADSFFIKSGGKSSTAQTGQFKNKKEILNTWFCSFVPFDSPNYILVILKEDGNFGMSDLGDVTNKINSYISFSD